MQRWGLLAIPLLCGISLVSAAEVVPNGTISFSQARERILAQNAGIKAVQSDIDAARQGIKQARALPNPGASLTLEKFGANEIGATIGQTFELGGKRRLRTDAATNELERIRNNQRLAGIELEAEILRRFVPIAILSRKLSLLDSMIASAEVTKEQIRIKVEAGGTRKTDLIRAEIGGEQLAMERSEIVREASQARKRFAALGGVEDSALMHVFGALDIEAVLPSLDSLRSAIKNSPRFAATEIQKSLLETEKSQLKAQSIPDLDISAGYIKKIPENVDAPLVGLSMDLPIFNRNAAARNKLEFQRQALITRRDSDLQLLNADVQDLYSRILEINKKIAALQTITIPKAETVFGMSREFYSAGNASYTELSSAQSELLRLRMDILELESEWALSATDMMQITSLTIVIVK